MDRGKLELSESWAKLRVHIEKRVQKYSVLVSVWLQLLEIQVPFSSFSASCSVELRTWESSVTIVASVSQFKCTIIIKHSLQTTIELQFE